MLYSLNYNFCNIIKSLKDITEKVRLVVLHGLAGADGLKSFFPRDISGLLVLVAEDSDKLVE